MTTLLGTVSILAWSFLGAIVIWMGRLLKKDTINLHTLAQYFLFVGILFFVGMATGAATLLLRRNVSSTEIWRVFFVFSGEAETALLRFGIGIAYLMLIGTVIFAIVPSAHPPSGSDTPDG